MTKAADLTAYLFDNHHSALSVELMHWMDASPRFTAFVETYRDKIRKKVRTAHEREYTLDVRAELEVACCLLNDRRLALVYEPYASARQRGPDFSVTYRANLVFNLEVARMRVEEDGVNKDPIDLARKQERIVRILLDKLGQMQPGMPNLLVIHTGEALARLIDLARLMQSVKRRVEGKDPSFYAGTPYTSPAAFYRDFLHLSGMVLWDGEGQVWVNKQAKPALDEKVIRLVGCGRQ
jgi:hypothetical protein